MEENNELQPKQTLTLKDLNERECRAIELRYLGKTSQEIAEATGYNDVYIRNLFMRGGRLSKAYEDFAQTQQDYAKAKIESALNRAAEEALNAIERIIALSKDAQNEAAIFKANEFLLTLAGVSNQATLRGFFQNKTYDQAKAMAEEIFNDLYQKSLVQGNFTVILLSECEHCGNPAKQIKL